MKKVSAASERQRVFGCGGGEGVRLRLLPRRLRTLLPLLLCLLLCLLLLGGGVSCDRRLLLGGGQQAEVGHPHLRNVPFNSVLFIFPRAQLALHIQAVALMHVLPHHSREASRSGDVVPFRPFGDLCAVPFRVPFLCCGEGEVRDLPAAVECPAPWVSAHVAKQYYLVYPVHVMIFLGFTLRFCMSRTRR